MCCYVDSDWPPVWRDTLDTEVQIQIRTRVTHPQVPSCTLHCKCATSRIPRASSIEADEILQDILSTLLGSLLLWCRCRLPPRLTNHRRQPSCLKCHTFFHLSIYHWGRFGFLLKYVVWIKVGRLCTEKETLGYQQRNVSRWNKEEDSLTVSWNWTRWKLPWLPLEEERGGEMVELKNCTWLSACQKDGGRKCLCVMLCLWTS